MLRIHLTKFGKSRQAPVHPSTLEALRQYCQRSDLAGESDGDDTAFFVGSRGRLHCLPIGDRQVQCVFCELRRQLGWPDCGSHDAARIHDLTHTFVVRRIVQWQAQGVDIDQAMLSLSTYIGHAMVTNTYGYLWAVPDLIAPVAGRFEAYLSQAETGREQRKSSSGSPRIVASEYGRARKLVGRIVWPAPANNPGEQPACGCW